MNALISLKPSESETKSSIWAIDNAPPLEPCGADAFARALEEERYWHLKDMGDLLQPASPDAVGASLVLLHLLEAETECGTQLFLAHCKQNTAHPHPAADVPVGGVRGLLRGKCIAKRHG